MTSVSAIDCTLIERLPPDVFGYTATFIPLKDLLSCCQVSKKWNALFSSDAAWGFLAEKYEIKQIKVNVPSQVALSLSQLAPAPFHGWLKTKLTTTLKVQVLSNIRLQIQQMRLQVEQKWGSEFLEVFGSADAIQHLPTLHRSMGKLMAEDDYSAPITKLEHTDINRSGFNFMVFRIHSRSTNTTVHETVSFHTVFGKRYFFVTNGANTIRGRSSLVTPLKLERLKRLIHHEPVGELIEDDPSHMREGPLTTSDGKSVLELI